MSQINRTSPIRSGFDYQDLWGLKLIGDWLNNPDKYQWIQFETCPDDKNPNQFYLDDIVCLGSDNLYYLYQIKHRQDPTNAWEWDDILIPNNSKGTSIFKKISLSLSSRISKTREAVFITNAQVSQEISQYIIDNEHININEIKNKNSDLYTQIVDEVGNAKILEDILKILQFRFDQDKLTHDEMENNIRQFYYEKLRATEAGVRNLFHEIRKECRQKQTRQLDIDTLRRWCEFDIPRLLEEQFGIPNDFEFFDDRTHQDIFSDLKKVTGGVKVIYGKPGVGKSVYLSKLDAELKKDNVIVVKHHYHISPEDTNPQDRLNAKRVIGSIKAQLKTHQDKLGDLANKNSKGISLREFINEIALNLKQESNTLVIIVDGLDHALRYTEKDELEQFLGEICFPQPNVWIVVGMQEIAETHLPQIVFDKCPKQQWIEIKGLSKTSVSSLVYNNQTKLHLPEHQEQFSN